VVGEKDGEIVLRQRIRQLDGTRPLKETTERPGKLLGLNPTKPSDLQRQKGALVIPDNFGVALDPTPTVIPYHKVWPRLQELKAKNGGKMPRVLRNGQIIRVKDGTYKGTWRILSIKNNKTGIKLDLGQPDTVRPLYDWVDPSTGKKIKKTTAGCKLMAGLETVIKDLVPNEYGLTGLSLQENG
jgi:hypothetical protein